MDKTKRELHCYDYRMHDTHNKMANHSFEKSSECSMSPSTALNIVKGDFSAWTEAVCHKSTLNCNYDAVKTRYCDASAPHAPHNSGCRRTVDYIYNGQLKI